MAVHFENHPPTLTTTLVGGGLPQPGGTVPAEGPAVAVTLSPAAQAIAGAPSTSHPAGGTPTADELISAAISAFHAINPDEELDDAAAAQKLKAAMQDGQLTRAEFEAAFETDITEEAWNAFIGRSQGGIQDGTGEAEGQYVITNIGHLTKYFKHFQNYNEATAAAGKPISFAYFCTCDEITEVSDEALVDFLLRLDATQIGQLVIKYKDFLKDYLSSRLGLIDTNITMSTEDLYRALEDGLKLLINVAKSDPEYMERLELVGVAMFNKLQESARENHLNLSKLSLEDPLVAGRFMQDVFLGFVTGTSQGSDITDEQFDSIKDLSKQVAQLRELLGDTDEDPFVIRTENEREITLDDLDPNTNQFRFALTFLDPPNKEAILEALSVCDCLPAPAAHPASGTFHAAF